MNKLSEFRVAGKLITGEFFSTTVTATHGYDAIKKAKAIVGPIVSASAMKVAK